MIIVRGELIMYRTLDGVEWIKPIVTLKENKESKVQAFGEDAYYIAGEINSKFKNFSDDEYKIRYNVYIVQTEKGLYMIYTNFIKGCPMFLPLKYDYRTPFITQFLSPDGFRPDIEPPPNINEILSQYTKYKGGEA